MIGEAFIWCFAGVCSPNWPPEILLAFILSHLIGKPHSEPSPELIDTFNVSLHSPNCRQMPAIRSVQGDCDWHWKMVEIPNHYVNPNPLQLRHFPTY